MKVNCFNVLKCNFFKTKMLNWNKLKLKVLISIKDIIILVKYDGTNPKKKSIETKCNILKFKDLNWKVLNLNAKVPKQW